MYLLSSSSSFALSYLLFFHLRPPLSCCRLLPLGLPFHSHGETWLGLVYGMKRWFVYPPGASPPISIERTQNPLRTVYDWFHEIYPQLQTLDQPPVNGDIPVKQGVSEGYRPLECVQRAGDIMYVPSGWNHLTMNIGKYLPYVHVTFQI